MLKTAFKKEDSSVPFTVIIRISAMNIFQNDLKNGQSKCPKNYESFENVSVTALDRYLREKLGFHTEIKNLMSTKIFVRQL